jgi:hypothetical protein
MELEIVRVPEKDSRRLCWAIKNIGNDVSDIRREKEGRDGEHSLNIWREKLEKIRRHAEMWLHETFVW